LNPKTTGALAIVAALFAAFLWFYEVEGEADRAAAEVENKRVFAELPSDGASIDWIELTTSDDTPIRAERSEGRWELVRPVTFPGDGVAFDAMASALAQLVGEAKLEQAQAPEVYGLGDDARRIAFGGASAGSFALRIGRAAPLGSAAYLKREDAPEVHLVPTWRVNALAKPLSALRDARILPFDREAVREIALRWPGGGVRMLRGSESGEGANGKTAWRLVEPLETSADAERIDSLLTDLVHLRADGFIDVPMSDEDAGLAPPDFAVALQLEDATLPPLELAIGQERDGLRRVRGRDGAIFELATARIDDFPRTVVEVRDRNLSRFIYGDVSGFELTFRSEDGNTEGAPVVATREGSEWTTNPPLRSGVAADIVANLANLKARDIQAEWLGDAERAALGLLPPRVSLRVLGEGEPARVLAQVQFGEFDLDRGLAAMAVGRDEVFLLDSRIAENLPVSRVAFDAVFAAPPEVAAPESEDEQP
jgi:hypothetical protein